LLQQNKKQHCSDAVEKDVHPMVRAWIHSKQLAIEHVRNRRERMPVSRMSMGKCADYAIHRKSSGDGGVFIHIHMIVDIDEIVSESLSKN